MTALIAGLAGVLFGLGLLVSGMTNPANVIAFLDVGGHWRPALLFTMAAAVAVALPAFTLVRRRDVSLRGARVPPIDRFRIDSSLIIGSIIFGIGWGLSGICPGPGLVLLAGLDQHAVAFVFGLAVGALGAGFYSRARSAR